MKTKQQSDCWKRHFVCGSYRGYIRRTNWMRRQKGKSQIWESKIWSRVPKDSDPRKTMLARASSIYKRHTRPLVREGAPQKQHRNCQRVINIWSRAPDGARRWDLLIDWPSVAMWLWLWLLSVEDTREPQPWVSCGSRQPARTGAVEQRHWGIYIVGRSNLAKTNEELRRINVWYSKL
jgi:hypothetical protein